jgi:hypothetical protein
MPGANGKRAGACRRPLAGEAEDDAILAAFRDRGKAS